MPEDITKSFVRVLAELTRRVEALEVRDEDLAKALNQNAVLLEKVLKQQTAMAETFSDVEALKVTLGTIVTVIDEIWKTKRLRELVEGISLSGGALAESGKKPK